MAAMLLEKPYYDCKQDHNTTNIFCIFSMFKPVSDQPVCNAGSIGVLQNHAGSGQPNQICKCASPVGDTTPMLKRTSPALI